MDKLEKIQLTPEEIGSYQLNDKNKIIRNPDVRAGDFIKNESEFIDDPVRQEAWNEVKVKWGDDIDFYDIIDGSGLEAVFYNPDKFIEGLNNREVILSAEKRIEINKVIDELEVRKNKLIEIRLDYEDVKDVAYDAKFKHAIESAIIDVEKYISNGKRFLAEAVSA